MTNAAGPDLIYHAELSLACTYALRRPTLARESLLLAIGAAVRMGRPDLAYTANALLAAVGAP